jgi:hypothetical protein
MKHDIKFLGTTKRFGAAAKKLSINSGKLGKETGHFDVPWDHVNACARKAVLDRRIDRVVARIAADIEQFSAGQLCKGNGRFDKSELA